MTCNTARMCSWRSGILLALLFVLVCCNDTGNESELTEEEDDDGKRDDFSETITIDAACGTENALSICLEPQEEFLEPEPNNGHNRYVADSVRYFLTMKSNQREGVPIAVGSDELVTEYLRDLEPGEWNPLNRWFRRKIIHPYYSPLVIRFEFPPWLLTTGYGIVTMKNVDEALRLYATDYQSIDCRFFEVQPFGRCRVVFLYGEDDPDTEEDDRTPCPIYEEFTFNDQGEVTFIEAWTDHPYYLPMDIRDYWAEGPNVSRLSTRVPGLGNETGLIDPDSEAMWAAAEQFDRVFSEEFWDWNVYPQGPFHSMLEDINSPFTMWPNWLERSVRHAGEGGVLDGCRGPDEQ